MEVPCAAAGAVFLRGRAEAMPRKSTPNQTKHADIGVYLLV